MQIKARAVDFRAERGDREHQSLVGRLQETVPGRGGEKILEGTQGEEQIARKTAQGTLILIQEEELIRLNNAIKYIQNEYLAWKEAGGGKKKKKGGAKK